jgi:uncharacterized repeat protein (TIGR01451 family)
MVDGSSYTAPQTFNWAPGSSHTVNVQSPQGTGTRYAFANWSDGGAQSHTIVAPASAAVYTANFTTQFLLSAGVSPAGGGTITANPSSTGNYYNAGVGVQLTAVPAAGYTFSGFSGALTGAANPQTVVMSAPLSVTAAFVRLAPVLNIVMTHSGNFTQGETNATYTVAVSNSSSLPTSGTVTVTDAVPAGMTLVSMSGKGWTCTVESSACTRHDALAAGANYPFITVTVKIAATAASPLVNAVTVSGGGSASATATDSTVITPQCTASALKTSGEAIGDRVACRPLVP